MVAPNAKKFKFGPWLPDLPDLDNPGLTEALNVIRVSGAYRPYQPLSVFGATLANVPRQAFLSVSLTGDLEVNIASTDSLSDGRLYYGGISGSSWADVTGTVYSGLGAVWGFAQYNSYVIAVNKAVSVGPLYRTTGSASNYAQLSTGAPPCGCIGIIGQFVVLGNLGSAQNAVQWSGVNNPTSFPTPGSATAIAQQSGIQYLEQDYGAVRGISQGDQWGVILMDAGIVRMTYSQNPTTVFQFDTIWKGPGPINENAWIKVGPLVYFATTVGFFVTDGTSIIPIGRGKVDKYFTNNYSAGVFLSTGFDPINRIVYWSYENSSLVEDTLAYSIDEQEWTHTNDSIQCFIKNDEADPPLCFAFSTAKQIGLLNGTPGSAKIISPEIELNPGGKALVQGFRPLVPGASSVTCKIGSRMLQTGSVTYTSAITPNTSTGFADCLVEANYHRVEIDITGTFTQALGGEFIAQPSGAF